VADFAGALASRRVNALTVVFHGEWIGLAGLALATLFSGEAPLSAQNWLMAMLAGGVGSFSLVILYQAMAEGKMSIATSVSAVLAASLPVVVGAFTQGLPGASTLVGFALALVGVWLVSAGDEGPFALNVGGWKALWLPFLSGIGFGLYFILIHNVGQESTLWTLFSSRLGGLLLLVVYAVLKRPALGMARPVWPLVALNAGLDVSANGFYVLASQVGRLDVASVLGSLYPALTVLLAWLLLKEKLRHWQAAGIALALAAIGLIAL
jgi:drug/metabolite transporter (DMT)-like permease